MAWPQYYNVYYTEYVGIFNSYVTSFPNDYVAAIIFAYSNRESASHSWAPSWCAEPANRGRSSPPSGAPCSMPTRNRPSPRSRPWKKRPRYPTASPRTTTRLFGLFAALALVIAVAGMGSMLALWVRQRMREIGIRIALGASPADILTAVVRQLMVLVTIGLACGFAGALALTRLLKNLLFEVTPTDAPTYLAVSALLLVASLAACWVPARRAAGIDPQVALRCE